MGGTSGRPPPLFFFCPCKSELSFWQIVCEFGSLHVRDRPCAFGKRPRRSKNPSSRKLPALSRFFLFPNSTNYCHGCCHELPDHDRISLTTEPVQALSIVRVAHCWKRCPRLPLPRLQDPLRPGQIRGSCAEDRTCLAITHCFRIHHGLADAAHGPTLRASFGEERKTKHPRARPAHQRAQLGA